MAYRLLILKSRSHLRARLTVVGFLLFAVFGSGAQEKPVEAWWLHASFAPSEAAYDSLPVSAINPEWVKITILSYSNLPPEAKEDLEWMHRDGFRFLVDDYFKRQSVSDRVLCGVFEDRNGRRGRFLLIIERPKNGEWKVAYLHRELGEPGFSVLVKRPTGLYWGTCLQCEEFSRVRINKGSFQLESAP